MPGSHEIRRPVRDIWFATGLTALIAAGLLAGLLMSEPQGRLIPAILAVAIGLFAIILNRSMSADVVRLTPTHIEKIGLFGRKSLPLAEVVGAFSGPEVVLITQGGKPAMRLPPYVARSAEILGWVQSLDNLTHAEAMAAQSELEADDRLGPGQAARVDTLVAMRRLARGLTLLAIVIGLVGLLYPRPYDLVMAAAAALPVLALLLVAARPGVFTVGARRGLEAHPGLLGLIALPTGLFVLRATQDVHLTPWWGPALAAVPVGLVLAVLIRRIDPLSRDRATLGLHIALVIPLAWGALSIANVRLDTTTPTIIPVTVRSAQDADTPTVTLRLPPASGARELTLKVPRTLSQAALQGHSLCLIVSKGALGWRSLHPVDCTPVPPVTPRRTDPSVSAPSRAP